jgi:hypothetical protein
MYSKYNLKKYVESINNFSTKILEEKKSNLGLIYRSSKKKTELLLKLHTYIKENLLKVNPNTNFSFVSFSSNA